MLSTGIGSGLLRLFINIIIPIPFGLVFIIPGTSTLHISLQMLITYAGLFFSGFFLYFGPLKLSIKWNMVNFDNRPLNYLLNDDDNYGNIPITI